jgi:hypothetical protein
MKKVISVAVATAVLGSAGANAAVSDADWEAFKADYARLVQRVDQLAAENEALRDAVAAVPVEDLSAKLAVVEAQNQASSWAEKIKWKGDFRYRYEDIDDDSKSSDRQRHRIRARAALIAKPSDTLELGLGLATGGDDPVSTNQTLGGGGSTKDIKLDLAYARWKPNEFWLAGGKVSNPYYKPFKSALIWDSDYRPEGIFAGWEGDLFFVHSSYIHLNSDSGSGDEDLDESIWGAQIGTRIGPVTLAAGYLDIPVAGYPLIEIEGDADSFGNSDDGAGHYLYDYELITFGADANFNVADLPLGLYADFVQNQDADDLDQGYIVGAKLGKAKNRGSWQVQYQYQDLDADATFGLITDSDFMGGGTDGKGHKLSAAYAFHKNWTLGFTYFDGTKGMDLGEDVDYSRLMVDTKFKY